MFRRSLLLSSLASCISVRRRVTRSRRLPINRYTHAGPDAASDTQAGLSGQAVLRGFATRARVGNPPLSEKSAAKQPAATLLREGPPLGRHYRSSPDSRAETLRHAKLPA